MYIPVQCSAAQSSIAQNNAMQYSSEQGSGMQCSAVQCSGCFSIFENMRTEETARTSCWTQGPETLVTHGHCTVYSVQCSEFNVHRVHLCTVCVYLVITGTMKGAPLHSALALHSTLGLLVPSQKTLQCTIYYHLSSSLLIVCMIELCS